MNGAERREYREQLEADWEAQMRERMNESPRRVPAPSDSDYCGPNLRWHRHDFSMKGNDGVRRCFYCCGKKPAVTACGECNGTGKLTRLGGDWGKPDTEVPCWACAGKGTK